MERGIRKGVQKQIQVKVYRIGCIGKDLGKK